MAMLLLCALLFWSVISLRPAAAASTALTSSTPSTTTTDPGRCNGEPPPQGSGSELRLLSPGVLVYSCNVGLIKVSGASVIHCDVNATSWKPSSGLVCEEPEEEPPPEDPAWLLPVLVGLAASAIFVALLFCITYSCSACGFSKRRKGTREGSGCACPACWSAPRHVSPTPDPVMTPLPLKPMTPLPVKPMTPLPVEAPRIVVFDDYLVRQKEFL